MHPDAKSIVVLISKAAATRAIFYLRWQCNFNKIIALPSRAKNCTCSMSCAGNATSSEKLPKYCKLNILSIYLSANFAIALCSRVAFFPLDGNAIISENCISIAGEKLLMYSCSLSLMTS